MSHKTLLKRFRGEASTSTAEDHGESEHAENTPMEIGEPDEPEPESEPELKSEPELEPEPKPEPEPELDPEPKPEPEPEPEPRRSRERFSKDDLERLLTKYRMQSVLNERKKRRNEERHSDWKDQCPSCVKSFDDIVRKVHDDLLAGRINMVGVTLTRNLPIKTCNRRVQTSPELVQPVQERMQPTPEWMRPTPQWVQPTPHWMQPTPQLMQPVSEHIMYSIPGLQHVTEQLQFTPERMQPMPEQMQPVPEQMQSMLERRIQQIPERMRAVPKRMQPVAERIRHVSKRMQHVPARVKRRPERDYSRDSSLTRDFCGGTDSNILEGGCQCAKCLVEHKVKANARASRKKSRNHCSRIHLNRAHAPCKDNALKPLHQHILAGDKKRPGSRYVGILASLHKQGPCKVPCKIKADINWIRDHIPKQAETQTDLTGNAGVRDQGSQTNLARSIGVQKGNALALIAGSRSSCYKSASTQFNLSELPPISKPVGKVMPTVKRNRF